MNTRIRRFPRRLAGFTLIELMMAVAIVAVLAALAIFATGKYKRKARTGEISSIFASIAANQETYRQFSGGFAGGAEWCPIDIDTSNGTAQAWDITCDQELWRALGVRFPQNTYFTYTVRTGVGGGACPSFGLPGALDLCTDAPASGRYWIAAANANQDGDGDFSYFVTASWLNGNIIDLEPTE